MKIVSHVFVYLGCRHYAAKVMYLHLSCKDSLWEINSRPLPGKMRSKTRFSDFCDVLVYVGFRHVRLDQTEAEDP